MAKKWGKRGQPLVVRLPSSWLKTIDELVVGGKFKSRTAVVEEAVRQLLLFTSWGSRPLPWIDSWIEKARDIPNNDAVISVRLPQSFLKPLDELVAARMFESKSHAVKTSLLYFLSPSEPEESPSPPSQGGS